MRVARSRSVTLQVTGFVLYLATFDLACLFRLRSRHPARPHISSYMHRQQRSGVIAQQAQLLPRREAAQVRQLNPFLILLLILTRPITLAPSRRVCPCVILPPQPSSSSASYLTRRLAGSPSTRVGSL